MDCSLPSSSIHGIFQARVLEWVAISFSRGSSWPRARTLVSPIVGRRFYCLSHQGSPIVVEICAKSLQSGLTFCVRLLCPWDFPGKNTAVVCHLQGTINAICLNQPKTMPPPDPQSMGKKWSSMKLVSGAKKIGDHCFQGKRSAVVLEHMRWELLQVPSVPESHKHTHPNSFIPWFCSVVLLLFFFFHTSGWVSQMTLLICPVPRAPLASTYKYLGFIVPLAPRCLEVSVALTWTLWSWDGAAISRFLTY